MFSYNHTYEMLFFQVLNTVFVSVPYYIQVDRLGFMYSDLGYLFESVLTLLYFCRYSRSYHVACVLNYIP